MLVTASTRAPRSLREPHRGQRVGGLARLGDADHEVALAHHRVAVAVLGGDVHLDRDARPLLERVTADQARVVRRAAGDDDDPLDLAQARVVDRAEVAEVDAVGLRRAVGDRLGHRVGLLVDLLEHEGLVAALLGHLLAPVDLLDLALDALAGGGEELDAVTAEDDELVVLDQLDLARVGEEGGDGGGDELLTLAAADDQRALLAGADEQLGLVGGDGHERVVAAEAVVRVEDGRDEVVAGLDARGDQVRDHLGVGLGAELGALVEQRLLELHVVLDDPVDHDVDALVVVGVRVGVGLADAPVGRPARVADAGRGLPLGDGDSSAVLSVERQRIAQRGEVADRAHGLEAAVGEDRDARGVVAAVLELLQPLEKHFLDGAIPDVANDPAHEGAILDGVGDPSPPLV